MNILYKNTIRLLAFSLFLILIFGIFNIAIAKTTYSFNYYESITNSNFETIPDDEKIIYLLRTIKQKDRLLEDLTYRIKNNQQYSSINEILSKYTLDILQQNISERIGKLVKEKENILSVQIVEPAIDKEQQETTEEIAEGFASLEEEIEGMIEQYVYDKENIADLNYLYKISHDHKFLSSLIEGFNFSNNIQVISRKFHPENIEIDYDLLINDLGSYQKDKDIAIYLRCINLTTDLCDELIGKEKLLKNIALFIDKKEKQAQIDKFFERLTTAEETLNRKTKKLTVTSYNPECLQTKGGVMGKDGNCYATVELPCAIGKNKGKTEGLCGNPYIAATGHNLKDMISEGIKPLAVTQNLSFLKGKEVFLKCTDKHGEIVMDERCNGYFQVYDYKHERFEDSVDLFFENRKDNIGGVFVEIYYN